MTDTEEPTTQPTETTEQVTVTVTVDPSVTENTTLASPSPEVTTVTSEEAPAEEEVREPTPGLAPTKPARKNEKTGFKHRTKAEILKDSIDQLIEHGVDPTIANAVAQYSITNTGFAPKRSSRTLLMMFGRLRNKLKNDVPSFTKEDGAKLRALAIQYATERPGGSDVSAWTEDNRAGKDSVRTYFAINRRWTELSDSDRIISCFVDAAWPSKKELEIGMGGTFMQRWHYLILCVCAVCNTVDIFGDIYHDEPSAEYIENQNRVNLPPWANMNSDGVVKCECGSDMRKNDNGRWVCTSPICRHSFEGTGFGGNRRRGNRNTGSFAVTEGIPLEQPSRRRFNNGPRQNNDYDKQDRDERQLGRKPNNKRSRYRTSDDCDEPYRSSRNDAPAAPYYKSDTPNDLGSMGSAFSALGL